MQVEKVTDMRDALLEMLKEKSYRKGEFKLSSGETSEHYVNCKPVILDRIVVRFISGEKVPLLNLYLKFKVSPEAQMLQIC